MSFNSLQYLWFLPLVFCLYWFVFKPLRWQNLLVVAASYVFYGWWDWRFLLLIAFISLCSYASGLLIEKQKSRGGEAKSLLGQCGQYLGQSADIGHLQIGQECGVSLEASDLFDAETLQDLYDIVSARQ